VQADPPTDAEIAVVLHKISQRVIRHLRKRGYLEADTQDVVPTGYDPALGASSRQSPRSTSFKKFCVT
jgi:hypothetical protein